MVQFNIKDLESLDHQITLAFQTSQRLLQNGDHGFASAPSNIAFMKYWGKLANQTPANPNLSMTLGDFRSTTQIRVMGRSDAKAVAQTQVLLNGTLRDDKKLLAFVDRLTSSWRGGASFHIETQNSFPTACGIASSASGYAALVGAFADLLQLEKLIGNDGRQTWISHCARLGSGSATRSTLINAASLFVSWDSDNKVTSITSQFPDMRHCVVIVDRNEKSVSSSAGHAAADASPLQSLRLSGAHSRFRSILDALQRGDFVNLATHTEADATAMHSIMMTSGEGRHCYLTQKTLAVLDRVIRYRGTLPVLWTLDAGSNPHISYLPSADVFMKTFMAWCRDQSLEILENKSATGLVLGRTQ